MALDAMAVDLALFNFASAEWLWMTYMAVGFNWLCRLPRLVDIFVLAVFLAAPLLMSTQFLIKYCSLCPNSAAAWLGMEWPCRRATFS